MEVYDPIATQYKQFRENLIYDIYYYVETYTYLSQLGDLSGKSILDLGCGDGIHSRNLKKKVPHESLESIYPPKCSSWLGQKKPKNPWE